MGSEKDAAMDKTITGPPIESAQLGVYRVLTEKRPRLSVREQWAKATRLYPTLSRLVQDVYASSPWLFFLFQVAQIWYLCVAGTLDLDLTRRVLTGIETGLKNGRPDGAAILHAVAFSTACLVLTAVVNQWQTRLDYRMTDKLDLRFQAHSLRSQLATDLTGVSANLSTDHLSDSSRAWYTFKITSEAVWIVAGTVGQLAYITRTVLSTAHGPAFVLLCLVRPVLETSFRRSLWSRPHVVEANDPHFLRTMALRELSQPMYRQDLITGDLIQHILHEFRKTVRLLGDTDITEPDVQYSRRPGATSHIGLRLTKDLPLLYYALNAIMNPSRFSLATIATLTQSQSLLCWSFDEIMYRVSTVASLASSVKAMYDLDHVVHQMKSGDLPYPPLRRPHERGMPFELKNVSFSYPGTDANALNNITLSIKPGQLIVIVGANGSGKSTLVKLLTRLYDATAGSIAIDGADVQVYRLPDLRHATATLTQDHHLYPLSLRENIGLGYPAHVDNVEMIRAAAKQGGAEALLARMPDGLETVLEHPPEVQWGSGVDKGDGTLLGEALEKLDKEADVSGGERQRLVASRTFMRFTSGAVKLVCVDEPSSSLDPEAERQLFENLRHVREGKTMIFVTHRFAHLTKHADVILCMKEGSIVETGTHEELLA
ncbi:P-loop containing nucleoside triphosphate hydrolase protein [Mycena vitilis]|nr:P-loop containing nucleoside triphosphate hydrolase protein [Mycena vitilis]